MATARSPHKLMLLSRVAIVTMTDVAAHAALCFPRSTALSADTPYPSGAEREATRDL